MASITELAVSKNDVLTVYVMSAPFSVRGFVNAFSPSDKYRSGVPSRFFIYRE